MRIQNNITAINTHRQYNIANNAVASSAEKLSSGYRINRAGDDAAGLAISEKMRAQIRGLNMASKNSLDAISLVQTAEGALQETHNILQRMRELAVQSSSDTNETVIDRGALQLEFAELLKELDDTASKAKFNDQGLIDGTFAKTITAATGIGANHGMAWASSSVLPSTTAYVVSVTTIVDTAAVTGIASTATVASGSTFVVQSNEGNVSVVWSAPLVANSVKSDTINGVWNFTFSDGKFVATNQRTGEQIAREPVGVGVTSGAGGVSAVVDFGALGQLVISNSSTASAVDAEAFTSLSGSVEIKSSMADKAASYKHIATLGNDQVVLQTGMTTLDFKNTGISVNLRDALAIDAATSVANSNAAAGTINVTRNFGKELVIQTGANQHDELAINIDKMDAYTLGVKSANISNRLDASVAITQVNTALNHVSTQRAALGALQNRLNHKIANLDNSAENLQAAESRIRDVDMAKEMTAFSKKNILVQASTAMLAQANSAPQNVLQLLR